MNNEDLIELFRQLDRIAAGIESLTAAVERVSARASRPLATRVCAELSCTRPAEPGLSLCETCWDTANDAEPSVRS